MISKMAFGVRQVRDFLAHNGCVLTVRGHDYKTTLATVADLDSIKIKRKKVCEIKTIDDLDHFVPLSGFKTAAEWWVQIRRFCKGKMWLYRVQIDDSELDRIERDAEKIEQQRLFAEQNAWSNEEEIAEITGHPLDIRDIDTDPALVDLQPHRDAVHEARIQREARQAERRRERMREQYEGQGQIIKALPPGGDVLMVTGNRHLHDRQRIRERLIEVIDGRRPDIAISGMATGADQLFAEICIEKGIPVYAYIPFLGQENRWSAEEQKRYRDILRKCEKKIIVCNYPSKKAFFERNRAMVRASSRAVVVWNGKNGGTANTIKLIEQSHIPHWFIEN